MKENLFIRIARKRALRKNASKVPTGLVPLSGIKTAMVYLEDDGTLSSGTERTVREFFKSRGIQVETAVLNPLDADWMGRSLRPKKEGSFEGCEDLFVSLARDDSFALTYYAVTSKAKFKIGRRQTADVFDMIMDGSGQDSPEELFKCITEFLEIVQ